jgi:hypothetical protein
LARAKIRLAKRRRTTYSGLLEMIYCVVPKPLAPELFDKLSDYYKDDPNVEVIVDRRESERRTRGASAGGNKRELRDRRRRRVPGNFLHINAA